MTTRYDLLTSKTDRDGKKRYHKVGVMFPSKQGEGFSIKLESLPLPNAEGDVWISAFVPREHDRQGQGGNASAQSGGGYASLDDNIPFAPEFR